MVVVQIAGRPGQVLIIVRDDRGTTTITMNPAKAREFADEMRMAATLVENLDVEPADA